MPSSAVTRVGVYATLSVSLRPAPRSLLDRESHQSPTRPDHLLGRFQLVTGRVWKGSAFGGVKGRSEMPGIVDDYLNGTLWVDEFVTHKQDLDNINKGFDDMHVSCDRDSILDKTVQQN